MQTLLVRGLCGDQTAQMVMRMKQAIDVFGGFFFLTGQAGLDALLVLTEAMLREWAAGHLLCDTENSTFWLAARSGILSVKFHVCGV